MKEGGSVGHNAKYKHPEPHSCSFARWLMLIYLFHVHHNSQNGLITNNLISGSLKLKRKNTRRLCWWYNFRTGFLAPFEIYPSFTPSAPVLISLIRLHSCRHNHNTRRKYCEGLLRVFTMILGPITGDGINSAVKGYHELLLCLSQACNKNWCEPDQVEELPIRAEKASLNEFRRGQNL